MQSLMKIRIFCRLNVMNIYIYSKTTHWHGKGLIRPEVRGKWIGIPSSEKNRILEGLNMPDFQSPHVFQKSFL